MNCACVYVDLNDETMEMIKKETLIAKTQHICHECKEIIKVNDQYCKEKGKIENEIRTFKTCLDCLSIRNVFFCNDWYYEMLWEFLIEHIKDSGCDISEDCLVDLTPIARNKVCEIIEKCWANLN